MTTIALIFKNCLKQFTALLNSGHLVRFETEVSPRRWEDELGRLRVWAANIGAHQTGQSSLDYRLRDASHLKIETVSLLRRLQDLVKDLDELAIEEGDLSIHDDNGNEAIAECHRQLWESGDYNTAEVQDVYQSMVEVINYLYQMSMAIRQPAQHDQLLGARSIDGTYFQPWAQQHVSHKYPHADSALVARVGAAMAKQKAILKYRERHHMKLSQGIYDEDHPDALSSKLSETVATELVRNKDHLEFLENASDSGVSKTSYAATLMAGGGRISVPSPPQSSNDRKPFECPYCFILITIKDRNDWARHVFRDLMPYVCIFPECSTPSRLYESRRRWFQHLSDEHSLSSISGAQLTCTLCKSDILQLRSFERHVGRHLEELALFVLPDIDAESDGEERRTTISSTFRSELGSGTDANASDTPGYSSHLVDEERSKSPIEDEDHIGETAGIIMPGYDPDYMEFKTPTSDTGIPDDIVGSLNNAEAFAQPATRSRAFDELLDPTSEEADEYESEYENAHERRNLLFQEPSESEGPSSPPGYHSQFEETPMFSDSLLQHYLSLNPQPLGLSQPEPVAASPSVASESENMSDNEISWMARPNVDRSTTYDHDRDALIEKLAEGTTATEEEIDAYKNVTYAPGERVRALAEAFGELSLTLDATKEEDETQAAANKPPPEK